jgi:hypothetical protein
MATIRRRDSVTHSTNMSRSSLFVAMEIGGGLVRSNYRDMFFNISKCKYRILDWSFEDYHPKPFDYYAEPRSGDPLFE